MSAALHLSTAAIVVRSDVAALNGWLASAFDTLDRNDTVFGCVVSLLFVAVAVTSRLSRRLR